MSTPEPSPTGNPLIPPPAVPWLVAVYGLAVTLTQALPEHTVAHKVATAAVFFLGGLGLASPGWRRR